MSIHRLILWRGRVLARLDNTLVLRRTALCRGAGAYAMGPYARMHSRHMRVDVCRLQAWCVVLAASAKPATAASQVSATFFGRVLLCASARGRALQTTCACAPAQNARRACSEVGNGLAAATYASSLSVM
eukprot:6196124-Pleurochrysis_carterae.AAC.3